MLLNNFIVKKYLKMIVKKLNSVVKKIIVKHVYFSREKITL